MAIFLSHESAIEMLCHLRADSDVRGDISGWNATCDKKLLGNAVHTKRGLDAMSPHADRLLERLTKPLHVLVAKKGHVTMSDVLHPHLWTGDVGRRAFIDLGNDVYLSSPAFVFLQMASRLSVVELIMLGMMFCGYYAPSPDFGRSKHTQTLDMPLEDLHKQMVCSSQSFELEPICSERTLSHFIERHPNVHGAKAARAALPWVRNNSASHMESALYLLLCLPVRMGGYGLPKPLLNPKVRIVQQSGERICYPDLYWKTPSIDMEYASDWAHASVSANYLDSRRMTAIVCNDIDYLSITTGQLRRPTDVDDAARGLAKKLGHRIRNANSVWESKRAQLRQEVLPQDFERNAAFDGIGYTSF